MNILAIINGEYGRRHVENIQYYQPSSWTLATWEAPQHFPPVIDDPADLLPETLSDADLILSFAEHKGAAELLPEIAARTGAKAVLVAVDDDSWLPRGLENQLHAWLDELDVACATPRPLCSLTEDSYGLTRHQSAEYNSKELSAFARLFGQPSLVLEIDPESETITAVDVLRDAVCGCARHVAAGLINLSVKEAEEKAGLLHHHYPCLASMQKLDDFDHDTLMHVSGQIIKNDVSRQVKPHLKTRYITPGKLSE